MRPLTCFAAIVLLATTLSAWGFCQSESRPTYRVANLLSLSDTADAQSDAELLSVEITKLRGGGCDSPHKAWGSSCCEAPPEPLRCEVVCARVDVNADNTKRLRIMIDEYLPEAQGELDTNLTCSASTTVDHCYRSLLKRMARAVEAHDEQCHRGKPCHLSGGFFVN